MTGTSNSGPSGGGFLQARPGPRDRQVLQLLVLALLLIAVGVVIGKVFKSVARGAYRPKPLEMNLNLAYEKHCVDLYNESPLLCYV